jgi:hypothetical protein
MATFSTTLKVTGQYWTLGAFDGVLIFEAPDDDTATALMLRLGSQGFVQTRTARAFTAAEMEKALRRPGEVLRVPGSEDRAAAQASLGLGGPPVGRVLGS